MKIIFLDFDGVLNNTTDTRQKQNDGKIPVLDNSGIEVPTLMGRLGIDPEHVSVLNKIIDQTGAFVVISSSWRIIYKYSVPALQKALETSGFTGQVIGVTQNNGRIRGDQIKKWIEDHKDDVESFVILDDSNDMGLLINRLVHTSSSIGLKDSHIPKVLGILGIPFDFDEVTNA